MEDPNVKIKTVYYKKDRLLQNAAALSPQINKFLNFKLLLVWSVRSIFSKL